MTTVTLTLEQYELLASMAVEAGFHVHGAREVAEVIAAAKEANPCIGEAEAARKEAWQKRLQAARSNKS